MFTLTIEDSNGQVANQFSFDHGSYVIGRLEECDIVLPSPSVSRQHARVFIENGRCYIEDLGSANGVIVDGQRVIKQRDLGTASQIRVGDYYLYLEYKRAADQNPQHNVLSTLFIASGSDHHKLVRINDAFAGEEFSLSEQENTIGRTDENFILLSDVSISRQHATIRRQGEAYLVLDNGSSNGSRLNGKPLRSPQPLKPGDIVQFGNVQFVFVDGATRVDPRALQSAARPARSSSTTLYVLAAVLVLAGLAAGGMVVFGMVTAKEKKASSAEVAAHDPAAMLDARINGLLETARVQITQQNWDGALTTIDELLALSPVNEDAVELKERVRIEREAAELLDRAERLSEQGRHADARELLLLLERDTVAHERGQSTLAHVNKTLAYNLKTEANRLFADRRQRNPLEAHARIVESLELVPDDDEALELLEKIEAQLKTRGVRYQPYARN